MSRWRYWVSEVNAALRLGAWTAVAFLVGFLVVRAIA